MKITDKMIEKSLVNKGDISRILKVIRKAENGHDITIAFLGGSITQGCNATIYEKCYVELVYKWFKKKFENINVKCINAGVGATGSLIGVHRVENEVINNNPDIVFIDFAVNDDESSECKIAYESEIRKLLCCKSKPAVIEIFMTTNTGFNVQSQQIEIGKQYNIPMISYRNAIFDEIITGNIAWDNIITDSVHPNDNGHFIIAELLTNFIENVYKNEYEKDKKIEIDKYTLNEKCIFGDKYINGTILSNLKVSPIKLKGFKKDDVGFQVFQNGWKFIGGPQDDGQLTIEIECKNIILLYKKIVSNKAGKISLRLNGKANRLIDTHFNETWGDCTATEILEENEKFTKYIVDIIVEKENREREVTILGFLVS